MYGISLFAFADGMLQAKSLGSSKKNLWLAPYWMRITKSFQLSFSEDFTGTSGFHF